MAKVIKYKFLSCEVNHGTEENPDIEQIFFDVIMGWNESNEEVAKREAYSGEYTIEDDGISVYPIAPRNIDTGECVTVGGVLYLATENIPNGEPVIIGQNAIVTSVEEQLYKLTKED